MLLFAIFSSSEFLFVAILEIFHGWYFIKSKYRPSRIVKMAFYEALNSQKLISRKILVAERFWNLHNALSIFTENCKWRRRKLREINREKNSSISRKIPWIGNFHGKFVKSVGNTEWILIILTSSVSQFAYCWVIGNTELVNLRSSIVW